MEEFKEVVKKFKQKASRWSGLSKINIEKAPPNIIQGIIGVFNAVLNTGYFPYSLKLAKLIFIPKASKPNMVANFRPISLLEIIGKIFEKNVGKKIRNPHGKK